MGGLQGQRRNGDGVFERRERGCGGTVLAFHDLRRREHRCGLGLDFAQKRVHVLEVTVIHVVVGTRRIPRQDGRRVVGTDPNRRIRGLNLLLIIALFCLLVILSRLIPLVLFYLELPYVEQTRVHLELDFLIIWVVGGGLLQDVIDQAELVGVLDHPNIPLQILSGPPGLVLLLCDGRDRLV